jgi:hypothetical protein
MGTLDDVPLRLAAAGLPDPASVLGLAHHEPGSPPLPQCEVPLITTSTGDTIR